MLEGSVPEFSGPLISQPSPQPASSAPTHNGYALAVRGVRFCGAGVRVAPAPKTSPALARPLAPPPRTPTVKPAAAPQRRRSTGGGRKAAGMTAGSTALVTTPVPTPLPPDVTSRLKASMGEQRPRFCDRLNAMLKTGAATNDCDDDKDPYTFVESSTTSDINLLQRPLQQTIRTNGMVNRKTAASTPPSSVDVVKPKKRKVNNAKSLITSAVPANIQPKNIILTQQQNVASMKVKAQPSFVQMQPPKQPHQHTMMKPQNVVTKVQQQTTTTKPQNTIKSAQQQKRQESTSLISASSPNATSILRTVKFAEHVNNRRTSTDSTKMNHSTVNNNLARVPVTSVSNITSFAVANTTSLAPPLAPLKSVAPDEEKTTMNQLQARIARNRVIGKHQHRNNKSTSSQSLITPNISPQQLSKLKERSLLEEQLLLGIKQENVKQQQTQVIPPQQQLKTVTKHFTFPMKSTGSMVTYKKVISQLQTPLPPPPPPPQQQNLLNISKKPAEVKVEENLTQHQTQIQTFVRLRNQEVAFRKDLFNHGLGIPENTMEKECSSFQRHWFLEHPPESSTGSDEREIRLARTKASFRRRYLQLRKSVRSQSTSLGEVSWRNTAQAQVKAARTQPNRMAALLLASVPDPNNPSGTTVLPRSRHRVRHRWAAPHNWQDLVRQETCCFKECNTLALPLARHCLQHIMYNVDQQLFEYCTAKFADNTQCCVPVFDIQHELPLCLEHARKKDNYTKQSCDGKPKRTRKKAKPAAMTRPSKRGKKKRKGTPNPPVETVPSSPVVPPQPQPLSVLPQKQQLQQPLVQHHQQLQHQTLQSLLHHSQQLQLQQQQQQQQQHQMPPLTMTVKLEPSHLMVHSPVHHTHIRSPADIVEAQGMVPMYMGEDSLSQPGHDASLVDPGSDSEGEVAGLLRQVEAGGAGLVVEEELPLEGAEEELAALPLEGAEELAQQASRLLEEDHDDLASVLSQIPAETFNELFNGERTGVYEPTREETEELERALAAVDKDVRSLEKLQRQHNSPLGASAPSVLPAELVESILGGHLGSHLDDSLASLSRHSGVVKEEVVIDLMGTQHLVGVHDNVASYQVHPSTDLHSQLLPNTQDALIQLDAAVFPPDAMSQLVPDLGHSQGGGATFLLPQQTHQSQGFTHNDVSALLHPSLMHQNRMMMFQGLGNDAQQLMLTPAAVFGGGAAPPPTPNSVHQPAVANTPPFHHQNGYLQGNGQFDAKFACPLPSIPSPSMVPSQFTPGASPLTSNMGTQTHQQQQLHHQQQQQSQRHADS